MVGRTISHYRILEKLGEGGMGEVWRATDTKLHREVALKILPERFAADRDRMARFTREAHVLASLNHPNIATIYGVEERALVIELVEGATLGGRMAQGAVALEEALPVLKQIAEALEYAHERGIVHRDLKPANIKITPEGRVKVLDFGLAKAISNEAPPADSASSPTMTMRSTMAGVILGTAAYMAPEQAKGKMVDRRADIWAFGVITMGMLTGRQLYTGETVSEILAAVIRDQPDIERLPAGTPTPIRNLAKRCLDKDPQRRLRDIGEARIAIDEAMTGEPGAAEASMPAIRSRVVPWLVAVLLAALIAVGALYWRATRPADHSLVRLSVDLGPEAVEGQRITVAISSDARRVVFVARDRNGKELLATRLLAQPKVTLLNGTEGASDPFLSPDGEWIGFFANDKMKKISAHGGAAVTLCDASSPRGASWYDDVIIMARASQGLFRVPADGGTPEALTKPEEKTEKTHRWPQVLPGGQAVLFTRSSVVGWYENANIEVLSLSTGQRKVVQSGGYGGRYLPSGHLVYAHRGTLFTVPFDLAHLEVRGTPVPVLDDVAGIADRGAARFDFARNGTFVYLSGKSEVVLSPIVWLDSGGKTQPLLPAESRYFSPRFSPDGKRLALVSSAYDIYNYDWVRGNLTQLTFASPSNSDPTWTPDGKHILFQSRSSVYRIQLIRSDGAGAPQTLLESKTELRPFSFSPDGKRLALAQLDLETRSDLWTLPLDTSDAAHPKPGKPELFLRTPAFETEPIFSPDGRWIAYTTDDSGSDEVFVRPFPKETGGKWPISTGGGLHPIWSRNGRELFYQTPDGRIMVTTCRVQGDSFVPDKPRIWSSAGIVGSSSLAWGLDLAPDGKRFAVIPKSAGSAEEPHVTFLLNFFDYLRRQVPPRGK